MTNNLIYDFRGFYRTGSVDIGAFESGASKYILAIDDGLDSTFKLFEGKEINIC